MNTERSEYMDLLRQRHEAFRSLANEIDAGQQACIRLDISTLRSHDSRKIAICAEVRRLNAAIASLQPAGAAMPVQTLDEIRLLLKKSEEARAEARRRNQIYADFLGRARSSINMMMNVMAHCLGSYPATFHAFVGPHAERGL